MITIISSSRYRVNRKSLKEETSQFLLERGISGGSDITIVFVGKNKMREIAEKYKDEDTALPVLTFSYNERSEQKQFLGEIIVCYPQAVLMAAQRNKKVDETILSLVKHGIKNLIDT